MSKSTWLLKGLPDDFTAASPPRARLEVVSQGAGVKQIRVVRSLAGVPRSQAGPVSTSPGTHLQWEALSSLSYSPSFPAGVAHSPAEVPPAPSQTGNPQRQVGGWD